MQTINISLLFSIFRLDLVPINRSVGLKAKPTKPVAEVLRPVVAKYGLRLNDLVARIVSHFAMATCICGTTSVVKQGWSSVVSNCT